MRKAYILTITCLYLLIGNNDLLAQNQKRIIETLSNDWLFSKGDQQNGSDINLKDNNWQKVTVPHDWAIYGPFNKNFDLQTVKVIEDGDSTAKTRAGRTGGLPYIGVGWYRKHLQFNLEDKNKKFFVEFDGAMSHAKIYLNNKFVGEWPYGYAAFSFDISKYINFGKDNVLAVRLENKRESARWYPGAGIYRNVRLVTTSSTYVKHWGTYITTPKISKTQALVRIETSINLENAYADNYTLETSLYTIENQKVATLTTPINSKSNGLVVQEIEIKNPVLWSAESPNLYYAKSEIKSKKLIIDQYQTNFGVRDIQFDTEKGMIVNGIQTKLKGVCLHDDLGPLGMAMNKSALRYRLNLLKEMGCNAIRGTHNPQAPEMLELCDELGFYYISEAFDEWALPKVENGYHTLFNEWAKKDLVAMIKKDRNHPAVIMYSIGNEIREQNDKEGYKIAQFLTDICHETDPTRPVTAGLNNLDAAIKNGLANVLDIPGWNYKPALYANLHQKYPKWMIYGSETASTVSSRGVYKLPAKSASMKIWPDNQSSSYDLEYCSWSQLPDTEWKNQENSFVAGEFVWTGFDYLGEPTPYLNNWPSRSSYFGIIDLSGIPKDRYYLYQSKWSDKKILHILPHWNWEGKEGEAVPVYAYTNYPSAELFINGISFGKREFNKQVLLDSYRLRWENAIFQPGEIKVVAYHEDGKIAETTVIKTAGKPAKIILEPSKKSLQNNGIDLAFITVSVTDKDGNLCPLADHLINFEVTGEGTLRAVGNGDPTSLEQFDAHQRKLFYGKCMAIIQSKNTKGKITIKVSSQDLESTEIVINTQN
jgi:beta-galactosidase